ncbi:MAG: D-2-hydroxyacid dehydrogenase family protein [Deltaproteobacteria bacterium]|nr:D-2-hydroxyacid dehydrogenase family protein [Deltaproteobacteria bacterium]
MTNANFKVAILDDFEKIAETVPAFAQLKARAEITVLRERLDSSEKIVSRLSDFDALLLMRERTFLSDKEYRQLPKLKFIAQTGRTSKHLDLANATERNIAIAGTPSDNGTTTKELTVALILALARKIPQVNQRMREELWPALTGAMLEGKTIGVLGLGRIGNEVARIMKAFNTRVLGWSRSLTPEKAALVGAESVSMETLLKESDFITVHVQFNQQTVGLIGAKEIALMKRGAYLINTGRGPIIDEKAMLDALTSGQLGGVGLDVYDKEPLPMDHPLRRFDNAILMSHRGYATLEILSERYQQALTNILDYLDGKTLPLINPDVKIRNAAEN